MYKEILRSAGGISRLPEDRIREIGEGLDALLDAARDGDPGALRDLDVIRQGFGDLSVSLENLVAFIDRKFGTGQTG